MTRFIDTAVFEDNDATFPSNSIENYLCGLLCDLVRATPGRKELNYINCLVIAASYTSQLNLFPRDDRGKFAELCRSSPLAKIDQSAFAIPWRDLKNLLRLRGAILVHDQGYRNVINVGPKWAEVRGSYPKVDFELLGLLLAGRGINERLTNYAVHGG